MVNHDFLLGYGAGKAAGGSSVTVEPLNVTENGTYTEEGKAYSPVTVDVSGGGGSTSIEDCDVIFIDYDGTELYGYSKEEFAALTEMPANPSHTGLVAQGWNWTLADAKTYVAATGLLIIGQNYITASGATEIDIELPAGHLSPSLGFYINGSASVDWGDSSVQTVTGTSMSTLINTQHVYSAPGKYTIKISSEVDYDMGGSATPGQQLLWNQDNVAYADGTENAIYGDAVRAIRCGRNFVNIGQYGLNNMHNLETVAINQLTGIGSKQIFCRASKLKCVVFPSTIDSAKHVRMVQYNNFYECFALNYVSFPKHGALVSGNSVFSSCMNLKKVSFGGEISTVGQELFYYCVSLRKQPPNVGLGRGMYNYAVSIKEIEVPSSATQIPQSSIYNCYSLEKLTIPSSVTSFASSSITNLLKLSELHMKSTTPPTGFPTYGVIKKYYTKIFVPYSADHSVLEAYKTASGWSTYASYPDCYVEEVV